MRWPRPRFTVRRMMVAVAVTAVLLSAWLYRLENDNVSRSLTGIQLRALAESDAALRRRAVENLSNVEADDLGRVVSALTGALRDDDWQVRRASARSLATSIRNSVLARKGAVDDEIDSATRALIRAFDDPRAEVRLEAIVAVGILHDTITLPPNVAGGRSVTVTIGTKDGRTVAPLVRNGGRGGGLGGGFRRGRRVVAHASKSFVYATTSRALIRRSGGGETIPLLFGLPRLILSTASMPATTRPQMVYCPSRPGAGANMI